MPASELSSYTMDLADEVEQEIQARMLCVTYEQDVDSDSDNDSDHCPSSWHKRTSLALEESERKAARRKLETALGKGQQLISAAAGYFLDEPVGA